MTMSHLYKRPNPSIERTSPGKPGQAPASRVKPLISNVRPHKVFPLYITG